jgi:integral membrane protein
MFKTALGRFRMVGLYEGISFLVLLCIAMPLKYYAGFPQAVKVVGMLHGILFVLYILALAHVTLANRWSFVRVIGAIIASLLPFGTFVLDARLRRQP